MSHPHGAHLGGIRTLDDLRGRCVVDADYLGACWHLRTARGKAYPNDGKRISLWLHGCGHMLATRASWLLSGRDVPTLAHRVIARTCQSHDCVNPEHLRDVTRRQMLQMQRSRGTTTTPAKLRACRELAEARTKGTPEQRRELAYGLRSADEVAAEIGITPGRARQIRSKERQKLALTSVFGLGQALGAANDTLRRRRLQKLARDQREPEAA